MRRTAQPRHPAGSAVGGRFASVECPRVYALLDTLSPPEPEPTAENPVVEVRPGTFRLYAPKCPHGHFRRWADAVAPDCKVQRNCRGCWPPRGR